MTYLSRSSDFALYLEDYLVDDGHTRNNGSSNIFRKVTYISRSCDFVNILKTVECYTWANGSVWHKDWPNQIYLGQWHIFHGPVILLNTSLNTVWWRNVILLIMNQFDTKIDLISIMWVMVSDLYFMVQWFCLIFVRQFEGWMTNFG